MTIKVMSLKIVGVEGDRVQAYKEWHEAGRDCQRAVNVAWLHWIAWHEHMGTRDKILSWLASPKENRPKLSISREPLSDEAEAEGWVTIYKRAADTVPSLNKDTVSLLVRQRLSKRLQSLPSHGKLPGWWEILIGQGRPDFANHVPPIPIKAHHGKIEHVDGEWIVEFSIHAGRKAKRYRVTLHSKGRGIESQIAILSRIMGGEYANKGFGLVYAKSKKRFFFQFSYEMPSKPTAGVDPDLACVLVAGRKRAFIMRTATRRSYFVGGRSAIRLVAHKRKALLVGRWNRQGAYRYAGRSRKGHGRNRAIQGTERLRCRWNDFTTTFNRTMVTDILRIAVEWGCGRLIFLQPSSEDTKALNSAGKIEGTRDETAWTWYKVAMLLREKAPPDMTIEIRKPSQRREQCSERESAKAAVKC